MRAALDRWTKPVRLVRERAVSWARGMGGHRLDGSDSDAHSSAAQHITNRQNSEGGSRTVAMW